MGSVLPYLLDALVVFGLFALSVGVYGMIRLPGTYLKLHAASKAVFLGTIPLLLAAAISGGSEIAYRAALIAAILLLTTPIASHVITKAAYQREKEASKTPEE